MKEYLLAKLLHHYKLKYTSVKELKPRESLLTIEEESEADEASDSEASEASDTEENIENLVISDKEVTE